MTGGQVGTQGRELDVALGPVLAGLDLGGVRQGVGEDGHRLPAAVDHAKQKKNVSDLVTRP